MQSPFVAANQSIAGQTISEAPEVFFPYLNSTSLVSNLFACILSVEDRFGFLYLFLSENLLSAYSQ
jgi:hypothetical protein